jgi:hypothetical protein
MKAAALANRRLQPLGHLSDAEPVSTALTWVKLNWVKVRRLTDEP